ncbi:MAG: hypothetical protein HY828_14435 [Actinobacteria bacterium]|nr:hypothetical protein [Actinomycetota bacterium]
MFRTRLAIGLTAVALLGISACSSDSVAEKIQGASDTTVEDADNATNDTAPDATSGDATGGLPAGLVPEECRAIYNSFIGAMASAMSPGSDVDFDSVFGEAKGKLPEDIQKDVTFLTGVFGDFAKEMEGKQNDPAAAAAAIALFSDPKVQEASDRINSYFDETCPE